jgi:hypothetical protein
LYFNECADLRLISYFAAIKIGERENADVVSQLNIRRDFSIQLRRLVHDASFTMHELVQEVFAANAGTSGSMGRRSRDLFRLVSARD